MFQRQIKAQLPPPQRVIAAFVARLASVLRQRHRG